MAPSRKSSAYLDSSEWPSSGRRRRFSPARSAGFVEPGIVEAIEGPQGPTLTARDPARPVLVTAAGVRRDETCGRRGRVARASRRLEFALLTVLAVQVALPGAMATVLRTRSLMPRRSGAYRRNVSAVSARDPESARDGRIGARPESASDPENQRANPNSVGHARRSRGRFDAASATSSLSSRRAAPPRHRPQHRISHVPVRTTPHRGGVGRARGPGPRCPWPTNTPSAARSRTSSGVRSCAGEPEATGPGQHSPLRRGRPRPPLGVHLPAVPVLVAQPPPTLAVVEPSVLDAPPALSR